MTDLPLTYRDAGVDIEAGNRLVDAIKPAAKSTNRPGVVGGLGGFGGLFDLKACGFRDPLLVAATDGVGTKLKLAVECGRHDAVGIDLVAMCVNDLIVQGAEPLFFLDYYATGRLEPAAGAAIVQGIAEGCRQAGCALIGGETAEMPGLYREGDYDLAGFSVGAVERDQLLDGQGVEPGDVVIGLASSGLHSNGFSLVRKIVQRSGSALSDPAPFAPDRSLGEALLTPTRIYVRACLAALRAPGLEAGGLKALAHITGGGLPENLPRSLPAHCAAHLDLSAWPRPAVFGWLAEAGQIEPQELLRTFNCGIGMVAIVAREDAPALLALFAEAGERAVEIGSVIQRGEGPALVLAS